MGKTWVRGGAKQDPSVKPTLRPPQRINVWTRDASSEAQPSKSALGAGRHHTSPASATVPDVAAQGVLNGRETAADVPDLSHAAKRRRLTAKGRLSGGSTWQPSPPTGPPNARNGYRQAEAASGPDDVRLEEERQNWEAGKRKNIEEEAQALRKRIAEEEAKVLAARVAAKRREAEKAAADRQKHEERLKRKQRLDAGFAEAFKLTRELNARPDAPKVSAASRVEVDRVLSAKSDADVMQVQPGASTAVIKKRYRAMTLALHPDKCKAEKATDAFQRMVHAYQNLLQSAR